jgi:hypothetical protein
MLQSLPLSETTSSPILESGFEGSEVWIRTSSSIMKKEDQYLHAEQRLELGCY